MKGLAMALGIVVGVPASAAADERGTFVTLDRMATTGAVPLDSKVFTASFMTDLNYTYSFAQLKDHTLSGSTTSGRTSEFQLSHVGIGGDLHWFFVESWQPIFQNAEGRQRVQLLEASFIRLRDGLIASLTDLSCPIQCQSDRATRAVGRRFEPGSPGPVAVRPSVPWGPPQLPAGRARQGIRHGSRDRSRRHGSPAPRGRHHRGLAPRPLPMGAGRGST